MSLRRLLHLTLALIVGALLWTGSPAAATENPDYTVPPPATVVTTPTPKSPVKTAVSVAPTRSRLAITGTDAATTVAAGLALVGVGAGVLVLRRRRAAVL